LNHTDYGFAAHFLFGFERFTPSRLTGAEPLPVLDRVVELPFM